MGEEAMRRVTLAGAAALLGCLAVMTPASADDGGMEHIGGTVRLMKDQGQIRMLAETVRARVSPKRLEVDCVFVMENHGPADTVLIGFPDKSGGPDAPYPPMTSFRSWVDGVEVECVALPDAAGHEYQVWDYWWTKRVAFAAGQTRIIRDHYVGEPGSEVGGTQWFTYVLESGASWAGTIGSAEIIVTLDGISPKWISEIDPEPLSKGRTLRWSLRDFEPGVGDAPKQINFTWLTPEARKRTLKWMQQESPEHER